MRHLTFHPHNYYHIYNRGVNRQPIFFQESNWTFFLKQLRHYCPPEKIVILAYCLMPTHYHLLIYLKTDDLSHAIMQPFSISYTKAINKQQNRVGPIFQGPFQAKHIDDYAYLVSLTRYIHLNPVAAGYVADPADWLYSSYNDYIGKRAGTLPQTEIILSQFESRQEYQEFVMRPEEPTTKLPHRFWMD